MMKKLKIILTLLLLYCHALGMTAYYYKPIHPRMAELLFHFNDKRVNVKGVEFIDFTDRGRGSSMFLYSPRSLTSELRFAMKVECKVPWRFSFSLERNPTKDIYAVLVDGKPVRQHFNDTMLKETKDDCEIPAGEHEIVFVYNVVTPKKNALVNYPEIKIKDLCIHPHTKVMDETRQSVCGQKGYLKGHCESCNHLMVDSLPMPAAKHDFNSVYTYQSSCQIPSTMYRTCNRCGLSEFKMGKRRALEHNFQNGRCVNDGCSIKLPTQNATGIYQVGDAYELCGLSEQIAIGAIPRDCNIDLTADITYPQDLKHMPIGTTEYPFAGTFDGHGHRIGNMTLAIPTDMTGLFGVVEGTPRRMAVIANVIVDSSTNLQGTDMIGAIAGKANHCDILRCVNLGTIRGTTNVGGIVGYSEHNCHLIDCAGQGIINSKENGGLLSGTLRQGYIMDSYGSGSLADGEAESVLVPTADCPLRHCFQLDTKTPMTGVTPFSSSQLSDGTLARMLCEKNGKGMPAHWQQVATDGCPMPVFVALTDRPASVIQLKATRAAMPAFSVNSSSEEEGEEEDEEWYSFSPESELTGDSLDENFVFYDEADSTLNDFTCYVATTYRNVPTMPMFASMQGGDARECEVSYCKHDNTILLLLKYTIDGRYYNLFDVTKQYATPDSVVFLEHYNIQGNMRDGEFALTSKIVFNPDGSGHEERVSHGVSTKVFDWEVTQNANGDSIQNYYVYDDDGQQRVAAYSFPLTDKDMEDEGDYFHVPADFDYTLDENGRLVDIHYVLTDSLTGEKYNIGGEYFVYDEQGELVQMVSYEPVEPHSREMRQTEYITIDIYNADDAPTSIIPIEHLQPSSLDGSRTRTSGRIYDMRGNVVRLTNDAEALKSLPKGIYITRGRKILVY